MGELYDIAQRHMDAYGVREAALARRMEIRPQTLNSWKTRGVRELPSKSNLEALARETRTPYGDVLTAALRDIGYLPPKEREGRAEQPAATTAAVSATAAHPDDALTQARLDQARERWEQDMARAAGRRGASADAIALEQRDVTERFMNRVARIVSGDDGEERPGSSRAIR